MAVGKVLDDDDHCPRLQSIRPDIFTLLPSVSDIMFICGCHTILPYTTFDIVAKDVLLLC